MKHVLCTAAAAALLLGAALPAAAASEDMATVITCRDFMAMTPEEKTDAMDAMHKAADNMTADDATSDSTKSDAMDAMAKACNGHPGMMAMDAMKSAMSK